MSSQFQHSKHNSLSLNFINIQMPISCYNSKNFSQEIQSGLLDGAKIWPFVSVIIPTYNCAQYISESINSVLAQDYPSLEIIVVDDGSSDATPDIVSSYTSPVRLLRQRNKGPAAARNLGIANANGQYIAFLDGDDVWWQHKLRYQVRSLVESDYKVAYSRFRRWWPDANGCYPPSDSVFNDHNQYAIGNSRVPVSGWIYPEILMYCITCTITIIFEKTIVDTVGGFDETLRIGEDFNLWLRISREFRILGLPEITALYRIHSSSTMQTLTEVNYEYSVLQRAIQLWGEAGPDQRRLPEGALAERLAKSCLTHGCSHLFRGDSRIAARAFRDSLRHSGFRWRTCLYYIMASLKTIYSVPLRVVD